jgi:type VI protein secretion system component VasK
MMNRITQLIAATVLATLAPQALADSYRYMHVTIETPWLIFLGLLVAVMLPFILMAILYWRNAFRRDAEEEAQAKAEGKGGE